MQHTPKTLAEQARAFGMAAVAEPMRDPRDHPAYNLSRGCTLPLVSGGRKRQIAPQP